MWPFRKRRLERALLQPEQTWSPPFRTLAVIAGGAEWWDDPLREELNPDFPRDCPLFLNVCLRMPDRWWPQRISHWNHRHDIAYTDADAGEYEICYGDFEDGWLFELAVTRNADEATVRQLLLDLDAVLRATDGMQSVTWYPKSIFDEGLPMNYQAQGAKSPVDPIV